MAFLRVMHSPFISNRDSSQFRLSQLECLLLPLERVGMSAWSMLAARIRRRPVRRRLHQGSGGTSTREKLQRRREAVALPTLRWGEASSETSCRPKSSQLEWDTTPRPWQRRSSSSFQNSRTTQSLVAVFGEGYKFKKETATTGGKITGMHVFRLPRKSMLPPSAKPGGVMPYLLINKLQQTRTIIQHLQSVSIKLLLRNRNGVVA